MDADKTAVRFAKLIAKVGVLVKVSAADGTSRFTTHGFYSDKTTDPVTQALGANSIAAPAGLQLETARKLYVPATKHVPQPGDIVTFGKVKTRVLEVIEYAVKGQNVALALRLS
jgi:hypothetical protein